MKKHVSLILVVAMVLALTACGGTPAEIPTDPSVETAPSTAAIETTGEPTQVTEELTKPVMRLPMEMKAPKDTVDSSKENIEVPTNAEMVSMAGDILSPEPFRATLSAPVDPYRPCYDLGTCRQLEGDVCYVCIFADDDTSSWTEQEVGDFFDDKIFPGTYFLEQQASYWGVHLESSYLYFSTSQFGAPVRYSGNAEDINGTVDPNMLENVASGMGWSSVEDMRQYLMDYWDKSQVAFILILNKPGRSYAYLDNSNDNRDYVERCVLFAQPSYVNNLVYDCPPATVAHEILHLFGAEDYYAEGTRRVQRARLANAYYPNDLMLNSYYNINYNNVGQFTAYTVGWTDATPSVCYDNNWWIDS